MKNITDLGFCNGVLTSLNTLEFLKEKANHIYLYSPLMHNNFEVEKLLSDKVSYYHGERLNQNDVILFSAHGSTLEEEKQFPIQKRVHALCPIIKNTYERLNQHRDIPIYLFGSKNHREVKAILSYFDHVIFQEKEDFLSSLPKGKYGIAFQSTYDANSALEIERAISNNKEAILINHTCPVVKERIAHALNCLKNEDLSSACLLVFGSKDSANANLMLKTLTDHFHIEGYLVNEEKDLPLDKIKGKELFFASSTSISKEQCERLISLIRSA